MSNSVAWALGFCVVTFRPTMSNKVTSDKASTYSMFNTSSTGFGYHLNWAIRVKSVFAKTVTSIQSEITAQLPSVISTLYAPVTDGVKV